MGLIVFPVFRTPLLAAKPRTTGEFLAAEFAALDRVAAAGGVPPLTAFADQRPVPDDFDDPPWELDEVLGPCEVWFPAAAGRDACPGCPGSSGSGETLLPNSNRPRA